LGVCGHNAVDGYSVVLPEKLSTGKWQVHRSIKSPLQLLDHWPDHPEIQTLHDNSVYASKAFADKQCLGTRIREDGTVGE
jgi:long-chain acyl-CoA synthetase